MTNIQIKVLEWDKNDSALTVLGTRYNVYQEFGRDTEDWAVNVVDGVFPDKKSAKAAAEADHEARIRSVLLPPVPVESYAPLIEEAVRQEREGCAFAVECHSGFGDPSSIEACAALVRARGNEPEDCIHVVKARYAELLQAEATLLSAAPPVPVNSYLPVPVAWQYKRLQNGVSSNVHWIDMAGSELAEFNELGTVRGTPVETVRPLYAAPVNSYEEMRAALEKAADTLEGLSYIHDGNPSSPMADLEPVDYARHMLSEARQIAREAHKEARAALDGAQS